jgi:hypothetical protein
VADKVGGVGTLSKGSTKIQHGEIEHKQERKKLSYGAIKNVRFIYAPLAMNMQRVLDRTDIVYPAGLSKGFGQCFG